MFKIKENKENFLESEAKRILSKCVYEINENTILDLLSKECGFKHYKNIEKTNKKTLNEIKIFSLWELEDIEKNIIKKLYDLNEFKIDKIEFIRNEINNRKENLINQDPLNLFEVFSIIHIYNNYSHRLINKDWSLNEELVKSFLYQYAASLEQISCKYINNTISIPYKLKSMKFIERGFIDATNINKNGKNIKTAEGMLFELVFKLKNKELNIEQVYKKIENIIEYERNYHYINNNNNNKNKKDEFFVPPIYLFDFINNDNEYNKILDKESLALGFNYKEETKRNCFIDKKREKEYLLDIKKINKDEHIISIGTNINDSNLSFLYQDIISNKSVFYFDNTNDMHKINKINEVARLANKKRNVVYLNLENAEKMLSEKTIKDMYNNKKIVVIRLPDYYREDIKTREQIDKLYKKILSISIDDVCDLTKTSIYINELNTLSYELLNEIKKSLNNNDENKMHFRFTLSDLYIKRQEHNLIKELLLNNIKHYIIMKLYDPEETIDVFNEFIIDNKKIDFRDVKTLTPYSFLYANKNGIEFKCYQLNEVINEKELLPFINSPIYKNVF